MTEIILAINSGSTSVKFAAYAVGAGRALALASHGEVEGLPADARFIAKDPAGKILGERAFPGDRPVDAGAALHFIVTWLEQTLHGAKVIGAGHRIVLGGARHTAPVLIDAEVLAYLDSLAAMEPSHQPANVAGARALAEAFPGLPQVGAFDTAFHRTLPDLARTYALPQDVRDAGARRWGYHGISYEYISRQLPRVAPGARRVIVAHLGGGASLCAMRDGVSIETSMGFGVVSGLPMATRSGDIPPDLLFWLLRTKQFDAQTLETILYERSGLLGLSGFSGDMRALEASDDPRAAHAIACFVYALTKMVGAYVSVLGGLDALVFTAGIGEHSPPVRAGLCRALGWLGVEIDAAANAVNGPRISTADSRASVWVIPTDEELMIAEHALALIRP